MKQVYTTPQGTRIKTTSQTKANQLATDNPTVNVTSYKDNPDGTTTNTLSDGSTSTVKYTKTKDGSLQPKEINSVPMSTLANPPTPIEVPTPTVPTQPSTFVQNLDPAIKAGQDGIIRAQTEEAAKRDDILGRLLDSEVGSSQDIYDQAFQKAGGQDTLKQLTDASTRLAQLQGKFRTGKQAVSGAEGQSKVFEGIQLGELSRQEAIEVGNQALVVQALQGNFDSARQIALDTSNFAIEDRKAELDNLYNQYNAIGTVVANQEAQLIDNERRRLDTLQESVNGAITSGGASVEEMQQLTSATLPDDQKLAIAQKIVARTTQQDRSLERAVKTFQYNSMVAAAAEAKQAREMGILSADQSKLATDLRKEVNNLAEVKTMKDLEPKMVSLINALEQGTGEGDIVAINSFQNTVVDPGVAVREGDVALLQSAQSFTDKAELKAKGLLVGNKLTPEARERMKELALTAYASRVAFTEDNIQPIKTTATENGIDYDKYIGRPFSDRASIEAKASVSSGNPTKATETYLDRITSTLGQSTNNPYQFFGI